MIIPSVDSVGVIDMIAPPRCHWCRTATAGAPACTACSAALPWNASACRACALPLPVGAAAGVCPACREHSPPQHCTWAAFRYVPPIAAQVLHLKFHGRLAPAHVLGALMAERLARRPEPLPELIVPVPLHPTRVRARGYNQALELGRELARRLAVELAPQAARRTRTTGEQTRLTAAARRRNVRGAFAVTAGVRGRHLALLDDVITTGATAGALAARAIAAGAARVEVWAAARALPGGASQVPA
jgi:ComF family protein